MRKIKRRFPRRGELLATPFKPLSDEGFRTLAMKGLAIPCQQGSALFVAKWRDGPGMDVEGFLTALRSQGASLEMREFESDFNIRVVRGPNPTGIAPPSPISPRTGSR